MTDDDWIGLAQRVARALLRGQEPYAPGISAFARELQDAETRKKLLVDLAAIREQLYKTAWTGSKAFDPYDRVCEAIEELEGLGEA